MTWTLPEPMLAAPVPDPALPSGSFVELAQQGRLATAATAAARAVQEWVAADGAPAPDRTRTVEAAAPGTRTLLELNETLATLDPAQGPSAFTALDPQRVA
ncbi:hypothetical protein [Streptomyces collinus]|uniref:hypothetical protein n=1 Tax=Streptomyces collinus TaxID=42684 RepID=UPI00331A86D1